MADDRRLGGIGNGMPIQKWQASQSSETGNHQDQNGISSTSWGAKSTPERGSLRPVIIDGSNVAMQLGRTVFATRGILICARHFILRGHQVMIFLPKFRRFQSPTNFRRPMSDQHLLHCLYEHDMLIETPSRVVHNEDVRHLIICYDDYFIVENAHNTGGVIVSNDQYRDVLSEHPEWTTTVQNRLIMFSWANDKFMAAEDPFGRRGPRLHDVLRFEGNESIDPLTRPWSQEKFRELVVEIERALVSPPPPHFGDTSHCFSHHRNTPYQQQMETTAPQGTSNQSTTRQSFDNTLTTMHRCQKMRTFVYRGWYTAAGAAPVGGYTCFNCNEKGHVQMTCPHPKVDHPQMGYQITPRGF